REFARVVVPVVDGQAFAGFAGSDGDGGQGVVVTADVGAGDAVGGMAEHTGIAGGFVQWPGKQPPVAGRHGQVEVRRVLRGFPAVTGTRIVGGDGADAHGRHVFAGIGNLA